MASPSIRLVEYLACLAATDLRDDLAQSATLALLDTIGCGLYGANQRWGRIIGDLVLSAALAAAEQYGASGSRLITALVAGYEMTDRLSLALGAEHNTRGFHTTGVAGAVAATVAVGIVMGFDASQLHTAIGIACSSASGIKAFTQGSGGMVKRMHAGRAAEAGVLACELTRRGFTGPTAASACWT